MMITTGTKHAIGVIDSNRLILIKPGRDLRYLQESEGGAHKRDSEQNREPSTGSVRRLHYAYSHAEPLCRSTCRTHRRLGVPNVWGAVAEASSDSSFMSGVRHRNYW